MRARFSIILSKGRLKLSLRMREYRADKDIHYTLHKNGMDLVLSPGDEGLRFSVDQTGTVVSFVQFPDETCRHQGIDIGLEKVDAWEVEAETVEGHIVFKDGYKALCTRRLGLKRSSVEKLEDIRRKVHDLNALADDLGLSFALKDGRIETVLRPWEEV